MSVQAQEVMFIHSGQQCVALDIQNVGEVTINQDSLVADVSNYFRRLRHGRFRLPTAK